MSVLRRAILRAGSNRARFPAISVRFRVLLLPAAIESVVELVHSQRLDEDRFSRGALAVDDARDLMFLVVSHGDDVAFIPDGNQIGSEFRAFLMQNLLKLASDLAFTIPDRSPDVPQSAGSRVLDFPFRINHFLDSFV